MSTNLPRKLQAAHRALTVAVLAATLTPVDALSEPGDGDRTPLENAFALGTAGLEEATIDAEIFGATTVLMATHPEIDPGPGLDLICHLCSTTEVLEASRALGAVLAREVSGIEPITLEIEGAERAETILVDGVRSSHTIGRRTLEAGDHSLVVRTESETREGTFEASPGQDIVVDLEDLEVRRDRATMRIGTILTGLGAALTAAGTTMLVFDGRCASPKVDAAGNCETVHDLAPVGWSLIGAGAASLVSGITAAIVSAIRDRRQGSREEAGS